MRLVWVALAWCGGVLLAAYSPRPLSTWALLLALSAVLLLWRRRAWAWVAVMGMALALGAARYSLAPQSSDLARSNDRGGASIIGVVVAAPEWRDGYLALTIASETVFDGRETRPTNGLLLARVPRSSAVRYGDRVQVGGELRTPPQGDAFSYAAYLARQGIYSWLPEATLEVLAQAQGNPIAATLFDLRQLATQKINAALPDPLAALLRGILLGDDSGLDPALRDAFAATGSAHIIAISGFNMTLIAGTLYGLLSRLLMRRWWALGLALAVLAAYSLLVGASAGVLRAALMSALLLIAPLLNRRTYVPASLACAALLLTAFDPLALWDVGFQLSFAAVLGLAWFAEPLQAWLKARLRHSPAWLTETLAVTLAVQITTLPLILLVFGRLSTVVMAVNVLLVPVQAALLLVGGVGLLISFALPTLGTLLLWGVGALLAYSIAIVRGLAALPFADVAFTLPPVLVAVYFAVLLGGALMQATQTTTWERWLERLHSQPVFNAMLASSAMLLALMLAIVVARPDGKLHLWWLDVGYSGALLIQTPSGNQVLIDGGRNPTRLLTALGDVLPFNDRHLELLIQTQPDEADSAALLDVLGRYRVGAFLSNGQPNQSDFAQALQTALGTTPQRVFLAGASADLGDGVRLEALNPPQAPDLGDPNDDGTLALRLSYGGLAVLLPGDLSVAAQARLLAEGANVQAQVVQLPRHAQANSLAEGLVAATQAQALILQTEAGNPFGLPDDATLLSWGDRPLWRTDAGGSIHAWTDGTTLWVQQGR